MRSENKMMCVAESDGCASYISRNLANYETPLAVAHVPMEVYGGLTTPECALKNGTLFNELAKPYDYVECRQRKVGLHE